MNVIRVSRVVRADADRVYDAWTDIDRASTWLFRTDGGKLVKAESNAVVGGQFTITEQRGEEDAIHRGEYTQLERPKSVAFDFWTGENPEDDLVTKIKVSIEPAGDGSQVSLTHEGVPNEWVEMSTKGWAKVLDQLAYAVED